MQMPMPMGQMMQGMPEQFLAPVHWLGGVAVVTTIVLPRARELPDVKDAIVAFEAFEQRFAKQARVSIFLAGLSGAYMLIKLDAWDRFQYASLYGARQSEVINHDVSGSPSPGR